MNLIEHLAESRIAEAMRQGAFDNLPGAGRPLILDDDSGIPPALRVAYRILKNAGMIPPEIEMHRELRSVEALLARAIDAGERAVALQRIEYVLNRIALSRGQPRDLRIEQAYYDQLTMRISEPTATPGTP